MVKMASSGAAWLKPAAHDGEDEPMANLVDGLEVKLSPEIMDRLRQRAAEEHRSVEDLVRDALDLMLNDAEWVAQVEVGLRAADAGDVMDFDEFRSRFLRKVQEPVRP
jgi:predicted transcriptional regulator